MIFATISNEKLIQLVQDGNIDAISFIYFEYADNLFRYGLKFTSDERIIEDCLHDLFAELIAKHRTLNIQDEIRFYLFRSFRNNLLRLLSREKRFLKTPPEDIFKVLFRFENSAEKEDDSSEKIEKLQLALQKLSVRQREAIYLRFTQGLEYEEVALLMDMGIESCRNTIYRAVKSLRQNLSSLSLLLLLSRS